MNTTLAEPTPTVGRRGRLRRRFTVVSAGMLSILMAILGVSFAADSGTTTVTVTGATSAVAVYPVTGTAPEGAVTLQAGSASANEATTWSPANSPSWTVAAGSAGAVPSAGDLAYLDTAGSTATSMMVSLYVTNLDQLAANYSSYNFNLTLWKSANGTSGWSSVGTQVLTSDSGTLNWVVDIEEDHYGITLDAGGSFYTVSTTGGSLSPSFFIRATQL